MKKTFLDLGMQPLANDFSKKYSPPSFRLKIQFDTKMDTLNCFEVLKKRNEYFRMIHY